MGEICYRGDENVTMHLRDWSEPAVSQECQQPPEAGKEKDEWFLESPEGKSCAHSPSQAP